MLGSDDSEWVWSISPDEEILAVNQIAPEVSCGSDEECGDEEYQEEEEAAPTAARSNLGSHGSNGSGAAAEGAEPTVEAE
jgi:hypothetical protein